MAFDNYCTSIIKNLQVNQEILNSKRIHQDDFQIQAKTLLDKYKEDYLEWEAKKYETEKNQLLFSNINKENELLQIEIDNYQHELEKIKNNIDKKLSEIYQIELRYNKAKSSLSEKDRLYMEKISNILCAYKSLTRVYWDLEASSKDWLRGYGFNTCLKRGKYFTMDIINEREEVVDKVWSTIEALNRK